MSRATELADCLDGAKLIDDSVEWAKTLEESAAELRRLDRVNAELREAMNDLHLNVVEAMKTGGWVPTALHQSFWESVFNARAALTSSTGDTQ